MCVVLQEVETGKKVLEGFIGEEGKYREVLTNETEQYKDKGQVIQCIDAMWDVVHRNEGVKKCTRVTDGYLIPLGEDIWLRLLDSVQGFKGFVMYEGEESTRVTVDSSNNHCSIQKQVVGLIRGKEGVKKRLERFCK